MRRLILGPARLILAAAACALLSAGQALAGDPRVAAEVKVIEENAKEPFEQRKREASIRRLGEIGGEEAAASLVPLFKDPFVHLADHAVSAWITMLKGPKAPETQTWLAEHTLLDRDPAVRRGAAIALGLASGSEIENDLRLAVLREKDPSVVKVLAEAAMHLRGGMSLDLKQHFETHLDLKDGPALLAVLELWAGEPHANVMIENPIFEHRLTHPDPLARAGAVLGIRRLVPRWPHAYFKDILAGKADEPKMALAESLVIARDRFTNPPHVGLETLRALLESSSWRVRAAAVEGALHVWDKAIVEPLLERLPKEDGRIRDDVLRALVTFTGKDLGEDPDVWRSWWTTSGKDADFGPRPDPDAHGRVRRPADPPSEARAPGETKTVAFFKIPVRSKRIAFVFDLSGSMKTATDGKSGPLKIDVAREELARTLDSLGPETVADLFVYRYPSEFPPKPFMTRALGKLSPLNDANKKKVVEWATKQEAKGWGAFYEALVETAAEDVDTIFLLSDGAPSRGRYERDFRLVDEFVKANRFRRVAVNTVLIGSSGTDKKFMQDLADATGGRFSEAKAGP